SWRIARHRERRCALRRSATRSWPAPQFQDCKCRRRLRSEFAYSSFWKRAPSRVWPNRMANTRSFAFRCEISPMRILLMYNPKAGRGEHEAEQLMALLAKAGHDARYQSTKEKGYEKAF